MESLGFGWCCERARREAYIMINTHLHKTQVVLVVLVAAVLRTSTSRPSGTRLM